MYPCINILLFVLVTNRADGILHGDHKVKTFFLIFNRIRELNPFEIGGENFFSFFCRCQTFCYKKCARSLSNLKKKKNYQSNFFLAYANLVKMCQGCENDFLRAEVVQA